MVFWLIVQGNNADLSGFGLVALRAFNARDDVFNCGGRIKMGDEIPDGLHRAMPAGATLNVEAFGRDHREQRSSLHVGLHR